MSGVYLLGGDARQRLLNRGLSLCSEKGARLLYLCLFGSRLYGTEIVGSSDIDVRGVFLPPLERLVLGEGIESIHFSTGDAGKNGPNDIDVDIVPLQRWVLEQLAGAQMPGMDLLFSPSNESCILWQDSMLDFFFANPLRYFNVGRIESCFEYASREVRKYGVWGTKLGALESAFAFVNTLFLSGKGKDKLFTHADSIIASCGNQRYCFLEKRKGESFLRFCGRLFPLSIRVDEFLSRVEREREQIAGEEKEIDWKSVSHALRAVRQWEELLETGRVSFPLRSREEILLVKQGRLSWRKSESLLLSGYSRIKELGASSGLSMPSFDVQEGKRAIGFCYGLLPEPSLASLLGNSANQG